MGFKISGDSTTSVLSEVGVAISDSAGYGNVIFSTVHYANIYIIVSSYEGSSNCYVISKNSSGFSFGTSSPNQKISYKVISVSP